MCTHKSSYVHPPYKTKYRVENWKEYEQGLRDRGDVTIWFSEAAIGAWTAPASSTPGTALTSWWLRKTTARSGARQPRGSWRPEGRR